MAKTEKELDALHEGGHAVVALCFGWPVARMTISPPRTFLVDEKAAEEADPVGFIAFLTAGNCVEMVLNDEPARNLSGEFWMFGEPDRMEALPIAADRLGYKTRTGQTAILKAIASCTFQFFIEPAKPSVNALGDKLLVAQELSREQIESVWASHRVPHDEIDRFMARLLACQK